MHFIAMLAYNLPIPITYNLPTVLVSMAVVASGAALFVVSRQTISGYSGQLGCVHGAWYCGDALHMAAMQLEATSLYKPNLVALSIIFAIGASLIPCGWRCIYAPKHK